MIDESLISLGQQAPWLLVSFALTFAIWKSVKWVGVRFGEIYTLLFDKDNGKVLNVIDHQTEFVESVKVNNDVTRKDIATTLQAVKSIERKITQLSKIGFENMNSEYFNILFEHSELPTAFVDEEYNFMSGNMKFCELLGYTNDELRAIRVHDVTAEDDIALDISQADKVKAGVTDSYRLEKTFVRKDGGSIYATLFVYRIPAEGPFNHFIGVVIPSRGII